MTLEKISQSDVKTSSAASRGERLSPSRFDRTYWILSRLRDAYVRSIKDFLGANEYSHLIDYGCGNMPYRSLFPVKKYIGADFPGNELATLHIENDGTIPLDSGSCPLVLSSQVLEHVADVRMYLCEVNRVLSSNGLLFLSTHGSWRYHPDPYDYWRWTCDGLKKTVIEAGFEIVRFEGVLGPEATALQLWQDSVLHRFHPRFRGVFVRYMQWRIERADKKCTQIDRDADACVFLLVAKKC